ncbi:MAG: NADH-quinone oxidoreductase subunit C [Myxococcales bacterium]|nr:NADH-quinone oxidoreductase subunit C [Myxococcales bacterium]
MSPELSAAIAALVEAHTPPPPAPEESEASADGDTSEVTEAAPAPAPEPAPVVVESGMTVPAAAHFALAELLKNRGYNLYVTVAASHWPQEKKSRKNPDPPPEHFKVATVLRNPSAGDSPAFWWSVDLAPGEPIDSLVSLFAGADWQEREQWDLVGVVFSNHPDLRRLMLPEDWQGHPLRKDYAIDTPHAPWR